MGRRKKENIIFLPKQAKSIKYKEKSNMEMNGALVAVLVAVFLLIGGIVGAYGFPTTVEKEVQVQVDKLVEVEKIVEVEKEVLVEKDFNALKDEAVALCLEKYEEDELSKYYEVFVDEVSSNWVLELTKTKQVAYFNILFTEYSEKYDDETEVEMSCTVTFRENRDAVVELEELVL